MNTKKELKFFTIFEYEKEQEYLRSMHNSGWRFTRVTGLGMYHFEACQPEDVIYQLDYNQEGLAHKSEYVQMFADCGWEYLQDFFGYSYFRKSAAEVNGSTEIFCDEESRQQMMERVFKGRMIPLVVVFSALLIPQFILNLTVHHNYGISIIYGCLIALYLSVFWGFVTKYHGYKNKK